MPSLLTCCFPLRSFSLITTSPAQHHTVYWSGSSQGAPSNAFGQRLLRSVPPLISCTPSPFHLSTPSIHSIHSILSSPAFSTAFTVLQSSIALTTIPSGVSISIFAFFPALSFLPVPLSLGSHLGCVWPYLRHSVPFRARWLRASPPPPPSCS